MHPHFHSIKMCKGLESRLGIFMVVQHRTADFVISKRYLYELVSIVVLRQHYINHLTVLELHLLCNLEAVSVTKIGLQIRAEDALHIIKCEI